MKDSAFAEKQIMAFGFNLEELINGISENVILKMTKLINDKVTPPKQNDLMTRKEVSELLQKDYSTLHRWKIKQILLPTFIDGSVFYYRSDIDKILNENKG